MDRHEAYWHIYQNLDRATSERVLDVGCSDGALVNYLAQQLGHAIIGLDIDDYGFKIAKREANKLKPRHVVQCIRGDAEALPFADQIFDTVVSVYSLHHMARPATAVREAWRVLKPGGRLLVTEIVIREDEPRNGCRRLLLPEIEAMFQDAGFGEVSNKWLDLDTVLLIADKSLAFS